MGIRFRRNVRRSEARRHLEKTCRERTGCLAGKGKSTSPWYDWMAVFGPWYLFYCPRGWVLLYSVNFTLHNTYTDTYRERERDRERERESVTNPPILKHYGHTTFSTNSSALNTAVTWHSPVIGQRCFHFVGSTCRVLSWRSNSLWRLVSARRSR